MATGHNDGGRGDVGGAEFVVEEYYWVGWLLIAIGLIRQIFCYLRDRKQIDILRKMLEKYVDHHGLRPASRNLNVLIDVTKSINNGRTPLFLNAERVMDALGYDVVFQPRS